MNHICLLHSLDITDIMKHTNITSIQVYNVRLRDLCTQDDVSAMTLKIFSLSSGRTLKSIASSTLSMYLASLHRSFIVESGHKKNEFQSY